MQRYFTAMSLRTLEDAFAQWKAFLLRDKQAVNEERVMKFEKEME